MFVSQAQRFAAGLRDSAAQRPYHIVIGITHPQTCLTLTGRLCALREAGFHVTLIASPGKLLDEIATREGVEAIGLPMERKIAPLSDLVSLLRLWWVLVRLRPDLAEFSTPKAGLLGSIASWLARVPARVYMLRGLKLETAKGIKRTILLAAERISARFVQVVLCNSESVRSEAVALGIAPPEKIHLLGEGSSNGVDVDRFSTGPSDARGWLGIPCDAPVVGFVGRLTEDKGIPELVEAFDAILCGQPEARLLLVGWFDAAEDALSAQVRDLIESHPRIVCTGFVSDTAPFYRAMDVMVLPTWREGFPNVVLEAAATGIPVITTLCTGSRDSVVPEVTGLLIPPGYPQAISEAVLKLLGEPARRQTMGKAARAWVCAHYADERVLRLAVSFYKSMLKPEPSKKVSETSRTSAGNRSGSAWPVVNDTSASHIEAKIMGDVRIL
jgi:glycosyltransferase involved in cell wall biosynthesis